MACIISKGRLEPCKEFVGGLYKIWFVNFGAISGTTVTDNQISSLGVPAASSLFEYELKGTSNLTQEMTSSRENGTTFVTQTLTLDLKGADYITNNEIKLLAYGRPHIIVQDNYGSAWLVGKTLGAELTTSNLSTGSAMLDKYGYTLTFVGMEKEYAYFLSGSTITNAYAGMSPEITSAMIVKGS